MREGGERGEKHREGERKQDERGRKIGSIEKDGYREKKG